MVLSMKENLKKANMAMAKENLQSLMGHSSRELLWITKFGQDKEPWSMMMVPSTKDNFNTEKSMVKAYKLMPMVLSTKENLISEQRKVLENWKTLMELYITKANGAKINHRLKVQSNIQMELTWASLWMIRNMVRENTSILMEHTLKEYSKMTSFTKDKEPWSMMMVQSMKENLILERNGAKES